MKKIPVIILGLLIAAVSLPAAAHQSFSVRRGLNALEKGDLEAAAAEFYKAGFEEPDNPVVAYNLGVVEYRRRNYSKAAQHFMHSATAADENIKFDSLYNLGNSAFKAGDYASAVSAYNAGLEIKKDPFAEFNLKVAEEKLKKQLEKQQKKEEQKQKDNQKDNQKQQNQENDQQNKEQNADQKNNDGQNSQDKQNQQKQPADNQNQQNQNENSEGEKNEQQQADADKQNQNQDQKKDSESNAEENQQNAEKNNETASQSQELSDQKNDQDKDQNREEIQMAQPQKESEPDKPEASQRARAMKNIKVNPYMIEKILKDMENREREYQIRARNERRLDEKDPFEMDAEELRQWMQNRGRPKQEQTDEPDW